VEVLIKKLILRAVIVLLILFLFQEGHVAFSAPDPSEVEEMKLQAPLHLIGKVEEDIFYQHLPNEDFLHIRKMTIDASYVIKAPVALQQGKSFEVYYHYIPSWLAADFDGPVRVDIAEGDLIEIWLEEGKDGWEPVLSGSTVHHLQYALERPEAVKEPFVHKAERWIANACRNESGLLVGLAFAVILLSLFLLAKRKTKRSAM
jgi:hypothetical protein